MALQPSYAHAKAIGAARVSPADRHGSPIAAALRLASRLVLGVPMALGTLVLGAGVFALGVAIGSVVGFMVIAGAWPLL